MLTFSRVRLMLRPASRLVYYSLWFLSIVFINSNWRYSFHVTTIGIWKRRWSESSFFCLSNLFEAHTGSLDSLKMYAAMIRRYSNVKVMDKRSRYGHNVDVSWWLDVKIKFIDYARNHDITITFLLICEHCSTYSYWRLYCLRWGKIYQGLICLINHREGCNYHFIGIQRDAVDFLRSNVYWFNGEAEFLGESRVYSINLIDARNLYKIH